MDHGQSWQDGACGGAHRRMSVHVRPRRGPARGHDRCDLQDIKRSKIYRLARNRRAISGNESSYARISAG
jgi:hypothetical protein